jgi:hypothetical protein
MQQRKPDLMFLLALVVGLGVVVTTTVHGAEFNGHPVSDADYNPGDQASAYSPGLRSIARNIGNPVLTFNEVSIDFYGLDVGFRQNGAYEIEAPYLFVRVERPW